MAFQISTRALRNLPDYAAAAAKYDNTKPIRGSWVGNDLRPLGNRRAQHLRIEKTRSITEGGGDVYHAVLYRTRCVSYYPDGTITLDPGGHSTASTAAFINAVSPFGAFNRSRLWVHLPSESYMKGYAIPGLGGEPLRIKRGEDGQWAVLNPEQLSKKSYNRVTTARLRAHIKPLMDWMKITFALMADENGEVDLGRETQWGEFKGYLVNPRIPENPSHFFACVKTETGMRIGNTAARIKAVMFRRLYQQATHLGLCTKEELFTHTPVPLGQVFVQRGL